MPSKIVEIEAGQYVYLAPPSKIPHCQEFIGRTKELDLCRAAWGVDRGGKKFNERALPLHFRLEGPPGVGKNEIIYQVARGLAASLDIPFYMLQGHEEMTPEDLAITLVPDRDQADYGQVPLAMRASPLATAIYEGGLFFFDEISRVPERALSPLASVLDSRRSIYSAITGINIEPKGKVEHERFRFCCALNPEVGGSGRGGLPDYIDERTLPVISVAYLSLDELMQVIRGNLPVENIVMAEFEYWYSEEARREISVRQALTMISFALNYFNEGGMDARAAIQDAALRIGHSRESKSSREANRWDGEAWDDELG